MDSLRAAIERRLDQATGGGSLSAGDSAWPLLVLAALDGPEALARELTTPAEPTAAPAPPAAGGAHTAGTSPPSPIVAALDATREAAPAAPAPAYLASITVEGFRGVGPATRLDLLPGPGLTLVVGRNGSGKSSFAEACELLLTGDTYRWSHKKATVWRDGWRNLHHPHAAISCELALEGHAGHAVIARNWPDDATDVRGPGPTVQLPGRPRMPFGTGEPAIAWGDAITSYRPFLSYSELGAMLDEGPSKLYDALSPILGLGELTAARATLAAERKPLEARVKSAADRRKQLIAELTAHPDPRAAPLALALGRRSGDPAAALDEAERLATASLDPGTGTDPVLGALGALARLSTPDVATATQAAEALHTAATRRAATAGTLAARADQLATLLDLALHVHTDQGDGDCPVCGRPAALDASWHATKAAEAATLRDTARAATEAQQACANALRQLRNLPWPSAAILPDPGRATSTAPAANGPAAEPTGASTNTGDPVPTGAAVHPGAAKSADDETGDASTTAPSDPSPTGPTGRTGSIDPTGPFARHFLSLATATPDLYQQVVSTARDLTAFATTLASLGPSSPDLLTRADALRLDAPLLAEALQALRKTAADELARREDRWRPLATQVAGFLPDARAALAAKSAAAELDTAETWLVAAEDEIRRERFAPIAEHTRSLWAELRHESNVSLERIDLLGANTRRRVDLLVSVDGVGASANGEKAGAAGTAAAGSVRSLPGDGGGAVSKTPAALGVMSQGELNALALSLFIPRATLAESPFRFLLVDDPVQSMDPARVEGLARVLDQVAASRQVIVFTHDDRLPEAVRRLGIDARVIEVTRRPGSIVELRAGQDPIARALDDARALSLERGLPAETICRVVPGLCRQAVEAAATETIRRRRLARGERHADVEALLADAQKLYSLVALALFDDAARTTDVLSALRNRCGATAPDTFKACNEGAHGDWSGDALTLVRDTEKLARGLQALAPAAPPPPSRAGTNQPAPPR